jgi:hypothetical protein
VVRSIPRPQPGGGGGAKAPPGRCCQTIEQPLGYLSRLVIAHVFKGRNDRCTQQIARLTFAPLPYSALASSCYRYTSRSRSSIDSSSGPSDPRMSCNACAARPSSISAAACAASASARGAGQSCADKAGSTSPRAYEGPARHRPWRAAPPRWRAGRWPPLQADPVVARRGARACAARATSLYGKLGCGARSRALGVCSLGWPEVASERSGARCSPEVQAIACGWKCSACAYPDVPRSGDPLVMGSPLRVPRPSSNYLRSATRWQV